MTGSMGGSGGVIKSGAGTMSYTTATKAYTGATTINEGTLRLTNAGRPTATASVTVNSGGQLQLDSGTNAWTLGASGATLLTLNGSGSATSTGALLNSGSGISSLTNNISLGSTSTISVSTGTATLELNGTISGAGGLTKAGTGTVAVLNTGSFQGATLVTAGTLRAGATNALGSTSGITVNSNGTLLLSNNTTTDRINNTAGVILDGGGRFATGGFSEGLRPSAPSGGTSGAAGMGALTLQNTSSTARAIIDFATGGNGSSLVFSSLSGGAGAFVNILNWTGTAGTDSGTSTSDRLLFATNPNLTNAQLSSWSFFNDSNVAFATGATIIPYGNMYQVVPVPEPGTWAAGILSVLAVGFTQRRRFGALLKLRR
jgi:autotransporter-associated beta strand protein